jgi:outer membrane receptor for ferrienterochelin and colicin
VLLESGGEVRRSTGTGREQRLAGGRFQSREDFDSAALASSAYAQVRFQRPRVDDIGRHDVWSITPGIRVDHWSLVGRTTASPWIQTLWPLNRALTVRAGVGVHHQEPDFALVLGARGTPGLKPERAYHADVGIEGRITGAARWQMTVYNREDRDLFRLPGSELRVVNGTLVFPPLTTRYANALDGYARGIEWLVQRQSPNGFSGWASYALGYARYQDVTTGETFWGDYDQRHTVNLFGTYRMSDRLSLSARFRYGSNFPTVGYYDARGGTYFAGTERNTLRVPAYSRVDVRANRTFTWDRKRLTLFVEAINVANRSNARAALPGVNRQTFVVTGLYEAMVPLIPAVGILLEF